MLITIEDVKSRGYNLLKEGALIQGDFMTINDAAEQFIEECCDTIWDLIGRYNGYEWTNNFKKDMSQDNLTGKALELKIELKKAMLEQIVFIYENGDISASANKDENKKVYSTKALTKLYNSGILKF